jgi:serine/threonine protein kinase
MGPYEIEAEIGRGGMGQVFRARDTRLGHTVAIKVLSTGVRVGRGKCAAGSSAKPERSRRSVTRTSAPSATSPSTTAYDAALLPAVKKIVPPAAEEGDRLLRYTFDSVRRNGARRPVRAPVHKTHRSPPPSA